MTAAGQRFSRGDHLRVFRAGYFHHGVYDRDDRVFEFGGRIWDKPNARIRTVSLSEFERNGTATLVRHPSRTIVGLLPRAVPPDEIIQRAEFLVKCTPPNRYNLLGFNCEMAANWCVCGGYSESHQTRTVFLLSAVWGGYEVIRWARRGSLSRWFWVRPLVAQAAIATYNIKIYSFWVEIGDRWTEYALRLESHPDEAGTTEDLG